MTPESIIQAARRAAQQFGGVVSRSQFVRSTGICEYQIYRLFTGGWSEVLQRAGLDRHPLDRDPLSDESLLQEFHRVASALREIPTWHRFDSLASISAGTVRKRFHGLQGTLRAYRDWLELHEPDSPLIAVAVARTHASPPSPFRRTGAVALLPSHRRGRGAGNAVSLSNWGEGACPTAPSKWNLPPAAIMSATHPHASSKHDAVQFGKPLDFRGLRHAPINEQGVVYLFGIVSLDLGLVVEAIQSGFPDCEAKRRIQGSNERWQRVRIEFEFRSRSFRDHGHDPSGCDLIICWTHDWPACPIEVIELRTVIDRLPKQQA
jgi:hypothetical protein